jgi:hypothetical protein
MYIQFAILLPQFPEYWDTMPGSVIVLYILRTIGFVCGVLQVFVSIICLFFLFFFPDRVSLYSPE